MELGILEWNALTQHGILDLDHGVWNIKWSVVAVLPSSPSHKVLIRLLYESKKDFVGMSSLRIR